MCNTDAIYLSETMSFDLAHIDNTISKLNDNDRVLIVYLIHCCVITSRRNTQDADYIEFFNNPDVKKINQQLPCESLFVEVNSYQIADSIRFSFTHFVTGGLLGVYEHQENECWHPKIIIKEILEPNDIPELPDKIEIYRGCNREEFDSGNYGQAWTREPDIAFDFAFTHYKSQVWFSENERIVIQAYISREDVFYAKNEGEYEIVVNSNKIQFSKIYKNSISNL
jgi:hypothetical protein